METSKSSEVATVSGKDFEVIVAEIHAGGIDKRASVLLAAERHPETYQRYLARIRRVGKIVHITE